MDARTFVRNQVGIKTGYTEDARLPYIPLTMSHNVLCGHADKTPSPTPHAVGLLPADRLHSVQLDNVSERTLRAGHETLCKSVTYVRCRALWDPRGIVSTSGWGSPSNRTYSVTTGALEPSAGQPPAPILAAGWAHEASRPSQPFQVVQAVGIGPEPGLELAHRPRAVLASASVVHRGILHGGSG